MHGIVEGVVQPGFPEAVQKMPELFLGRPVAEGLIDDGLQPNQLPGDGIAAQVAAPEIEGNVADLFLLHIGNQGSYRSHHTDFLDPVGDQNEGELRDHISEGYSDPAGCRRASARRSRPARRDYVGNDQQEQDAGNLLLPPPGVDDGDQTGQEWKRPTSA